MSCYKINERLSQVNCTVLGLSNLNAVSTEAVDDVQGSSDHLSIIFPTAKTYARIAAFGHESINLEISLAIKQLAQK